MRTRSTLLVAGAALAGLAALAGCATGPLGGPGTLAGPRPEPVAATSTTSAAGTPVSTRVHPAPKPSPTVAKVQKWVKIYSGPAARHLTPNKVAGGKTHTIELNATPNAQIGTYVADGAGRTLYRFDADKPGVSTCNGDCAKLWPPLLISSPGKIYPSGVTAKSISYIERADHTCQVALDGHPLYYFALDARPGQINGQGVNGTWFAVAPDGGKTRAVPGALPGTAVPVN